MMFPVDLRRVDPARNMRRFYLIDVQRNLFGEWYVLREWGRLGQGGQVRVDICPSEAKAAAALARQAGIKQRRGYVRIPSAGSYPVRAMSLRHCLDRSRTATPSTNILRPGRQMTANPPRPARACGR
jgi:predicted DNA-binding WGR domain protein